MPDRETGETYFCPQKGSQVGEGGCVQICQVPVNGRKCAEMNCACPWRRCLQCTTQGYFEPDAVITDFGREQGLCDWHMQNGSTAKREPSKPSGLRPRAFDTTTLQEEGGSEMADDNGSKPQVDVEALLGDMSAAQLTALAAKASARAPEKRDEEILALADKWEDEARSLGMDVRKLLLAAKRLRGDSSTTVKLTMGTTYQDPDNPENTWTCKKGSRPKWLQELIAAGTDPTTLAVEASQ